MTQTLPLFPLDSVLLPGATLPLHIFEARYRQLVTDLVGGAVPHRRFGVIRIRQGSEVGADGVESMYDIGCSAVLERARQLPEGRYDVTISGEQRFRLLGVDHEAAPYLTATVQWLSDTTPATESIDYLCAAARSAHARYHASGLRREGYEPPDADTPFDQLAYDLVDDCMLSNEDRQAVLEELDPLARLRLVRSMLLRETELLRELRAIPVPLATFAEQTSVN